MKHLYLKSVRGRNLGTVTLHDDATVTADNEDVEDVFSSFALVRNLSRAEAFEQFDGWSNGYAVVAKEPWPET